MVLAGPARAERGLEGRPVVARKAVAGAAAAAVAVTRKAAAGAVVGLAGAALRTWNDPEAGGGKALA